jgi:hypothetical protein
MKDIYILIDMSPWMTDIPLKNQFINDVKKLKSGTYRVIHQRYTVVVEFAFEEDLIVLTLQHGKIYEMHNYKEKMSKIEKCFVI